MELFSEVYGCYFTVVSHILESARKGLTKTEIERLVDTHGFYDSAFHLLPSLFSGEWELLEKQENSYFSKIKNTAKRPLTTLESAWLKALLSDPRIRLFLSDSAITELEEVLADVDPLYFQEDFHYYDRHSDGDNYTDEEYRERFRTVLAACKSGCPLMIEYDSGQGRRTKRQYHPYKIGYSLRDDKFRLFCAVFNQKENRLKKVTLNLGRMTAVKPSEHSFSVTADLQSLYSTPNLKEPAALEISKERNALERCMMQFASYERQTEYDRERDVYTCRLWFDPADETELLIRVLSFGPVVKVLGPENFLRQVKERIGRQLERNSQEDFSDDYRSV